MKHSRPEISVVVSTYNRCDDLDRALRALVLQDASEIAYEVVVVDNNSSDRTRETVFRYLNHPEADVRYVFEERQGVSYGRNAGIQAARAPIVAFTDDDNEVDPTWIRTIKASLDAHQDVAAIGGRILPDWSAPVPAWLDRRHWSPLAILDYGEQPFQTSRSNPICLLTANLAVRRPVLDRLGGFAPQYQRCQDHELLIRLWRSGSLAMYVPGLIVRTRIVPERLTRRYHRAWHKRHGFYSAAMRLQEIIDASGHLADPPADATRLCGTPGFVYRELGREIRGLAAAVVRLDRSRALHHRHNIGYLVAYIRRTSRTARRHRSLPLEVLEFAIGYLRKRAGLVGMSARRLMMAVAAIACVVGGSVYDIVRDQEHWPFSQYPMFSGVERDLRLERLRVVGVTDTAVPSEVVLLDSRFIEPFDQCRLSTALARTVNNPSRRPLADAMLADVLSRYEQRRQAGEHDGPPLAAVRLYRMEWRLDPNARNADAPDVRQALREVSTPLRRTGS